MRSARSLIIDGNGTQFDPMVVNAFLAHEKQFESIAHRYVDVPYVETPVPKEERKSA